MPEPEGNERLESRRYLRELLIGHPLWAEARFWEHALWQLVIDQLQTIPNEVPWHDIDVAERDIAVKRVHEVIFSQVMAIIHSMLELGCSKARTKELVYRMSVIHQLTEAQRHFLIGHIIEKQEVDVLVSTQLRLCPSSLIEEAKENSPVSDEVEVGHSEFAKICGAESA